MFYGVAEIHTDEEDIFFLKTKLNKVQAAKLKTDKQFHKLKHKHRTKKALIKIIAFMLKERNSKLSAESTSLG